MLSSIIKSILSMILAYFTGDNMSYGIQTQTRYCNVLKRLKTPQTHYSRVTIILYYSVARIIVLVYYSITRIIALVYYLHCRIVDCIYYSQIAIISPRDRKLTYANTLSTIEIES